MSSQFLIDSEASLKGIEARLNVEAPPNAANAAPRYTSEARVEKVGRDAITLSHGAIPALKWSAMTMDFKLPPQGLPRGLAAGDRVGIEFYMDADNLPQLTTVNTSRAKP